MPSATRCCFFGIVGGLLVRGWDDDGGMATMSAWRIPVAGLAWLLPRPRQILQGVLAHGLALLVLLAVGGVIGWWLWPDPLAGWRAWLMALVALGAALGAAVFAWALLLPVLLALVLDTVAEAVFAQRGVPPVAAPVLRSLTGTLIVLVRTLPRRLGWSAVALLSPLLGPLGILVTAYAMARIASADALDTALALRGASGSERLAALARMRRELRWASLTAAALQIALAATFVGWLLWMPALVAGYALRVADDPRA